MQRHLNVPLKFKKEKQDSELPNIGRFKPSQYRRYQKNRRKACLGCGSNSHSTWERSSKCAARGKICLNCNKANTFADVCHVKKTDTENQQDGIGGLTVHFREKNGKYTNLSALNNVTEMEVEMSAYLQTGNQSNSVRF